MYYNAKFHCQRQWSFGGRPSHHDSVVSGLVENNTQSYYISLFIYYYFIFAPSTFFSFSSSSFNRHSSICAAIPTESILLLVPILQQIMEEKKKTKFGSKYTCNIFSLYNVRIIHNNIHYEHYTTNLGQRFNVLQVVVDKRVAAAWQ